MIITVHLICILPICYDDEGGYPMIERNMIGKDTYIT